MNQYDDKTLQNRIKEYKTIPAKDLVADPRNWRLHPELQKERLAGVMSKIGKADVCIVREIDDGKYMLIDGHLRTEVAEDDEEIPCIVTDLDEAEAGVLLATLDPLASLAIPDDAALHDLIDALDDPYMKRIANEIADMDWYINAETVEAAKAEETDAVSTLRVRCLTDDSEKVEAVVTEAVKEFQHVELKWTRGG